MVVEYIEVNGTVEAVPVLIDVAGTREHGEMFGKN